MEENEIIIPQERLLKELIDFKKWSGPYLVKIMADIKEYGDDPIPLGSGGLLKYKNRYFVVTNSHVVRMIDKENFKQQLVIPYSLKNEESFKMHIIEGFKDTQLDIAVFEVRMNEDILKSNHQFLDQHYIDYDIKSFVEKTNVVFTQGYPYYATSIDSIAKEIIAESLPFCTFVENFNEDENSLYLTADQEGTDENGNKVELGHFGGMSGCFVYGYYYNEPKPYRCLGVLTEWHQSDSLLVVYPMDEFINYIEEKFFTM